MSKMIQIVSRRPGFLRAGMPHPAVATYPLDFFSADQLQLLIAEPLLQLTLVDVDSRQEEALTADAIDKMCAEILARSVDAHRLTGTRTGGSVGLASGTGSGPGVPVGVPEATTADLDPAAALIQAGQDGRPLGAPVVTEAGEASVLQGPALGGVVSAEPLPDTTVKPAAPARPARPGKATG